MYYCFAFPICFAALLLSFSLLFPFRLLPSPGSSMNVRKHKTTKFKLLPLYTEDLVALDPNGEAFVQVVCGDEIRKTSFGKASGNQIHWNEPLHFTLNPRNMTYVQVSPSGRGLSHGMSGFHLRGGGGSIEPPKTGGGVGKRAQLTGTINQLL